MGGSAICWNDREKTRAGFTLWQPLRGEVGLTGRGVAFIRHGSTLNAQGVSSDSSVWSVAQDLDSCMRRTQTGSAAAPLGLWTAQYTHSAAVLSAAGLTRWWFFDG